MVIIFMLIVLGIKALSLYAEWYYDSLDNYHILDQVNISWSVGKDDIIESGGCKLIQHKITKRKRLIYYGYNPYNHPAVVRFRNGHHGSVCASAREVIRTRKEKLKFY